MSNPIVRRTAGFWPLLIIFASTPGLGRAQTPAPPQGQKPYTTEIPYRGSTLVLTADTQELIGTKRRASGHVVMTYDDIEVTCDAAEYDEATGKGSTSGPTRFSQKQVWLTCSKAEFDLGSQTGAFHDAMGYTDQGFWIEGKTILKTGRDTYEVKQGSITACPEQRPKWQFRIGDASIRVDQTARLSRVLFQIKGLPVLYLPYLILPMERKERSSGFLPFHTGTSNSKGRQFSLGYFQTLGQSADITFYGDYFSQRGAGFGGIFRSAPSEETRLNVTAYGVNDRLGQGGAHLVVDGKTRFENGFRAVASVNITTNFRFRQAFSEGFRSATVPEEQSILFATRNDDSFSANLAFERKEVLFPGRSLIIRKSPSLELISLGKPLGRLPLILSFHASAEGLFRSDSTMETPRIVQRLDFYPRIAVRLPSLAGFSLLPSFGIRETYYGARLPVAPSSGAEADPLNRRYADVEVDLRTPQLERVFHTRRFGNLNHLVEPQIAYRWIRGISDLHETIRFDDIDAIADTNELEYGIVNRIIRVRESREGLNENHELLSFRIAQKYFFDPSFGGAFLPGEPNLFYPLNTLTGFSTTGVRRNISPTSLTLRVSPKGGLSCDLRADYDIRLRRLRDTGVWANWQRGKLILAGTYVKTNGLEPSIFTAHHIQGLAGYGSLTEPGFSAGLTLSYNIQTRVLLNSNSRLNYNWNCCGVSMEFQQFDLGLRTESRFTFSFTLKGIGTFGNLKRLESLF